VTRYPVLASGSGAAVTAPRHAARAPAGRRARRVRLDLAVPPAANSRLATSHAARAHVLAEHEPHDASSYTASALLARSCSARSKSRSAPVGSPRWNLWGWPDCAGVGSETRAPHSCARTRTRIGASTHGNALAYDRQAMLGPGNFASRRRSSFFRGGALPLRPSHYLAMCGSLVLTTSDARVGRRALRCHTAALR
jgi:hypothetical protein